MADYVATLKNDLVEQFRGKANIEALMEVIGAQLQQVYDFYDQLRQDRGVHTAVGKQLDGVGDIVVMTRMEAGKLAGDPIPFEVIDDETYRRYLIYKILKNTCDCTYPDIIKAFRMFWDRPLYYKEDPAEPATMIFDTGEMDGTVDTTPLFTTPLLRAAGVTLKLYARTKTEMETAKLYILSGLGFAVTETLLPILERDIDYRAHVYVRGGYSTIAEDTLPGVERDYKFGFKLHLGAGLQAVLESTLPNQEREVSYGGDHRPRISRRQQQRGRRRIDLCAARGYGNAARRRKDRQRYLCGSGRHDHRIDQRRQPRRHGLHRRHGIHAGRSLPL